MGPLQPKLSRRKIASLVMGLFFATFTLLSSLNGHTVSPDIYPNVANASVLEVVENVGVVRASTEPSTYALIAGGLLLSVFIFKRKLGEKPEADSGNS